MRKQVSEHEINEKWLPSYKRENHPTPLCQQLTWLNEIGFRDTDILWKYYNFAVYGRTRNS